MADTFIRKYGTATTVTVELWQQDGTAVQPTWTAAAGEVLVMKDEGTPANIGSLPTHEGNGMWSFPLTAAETQAARVLIAVRDAGTDVLDKTIAVETVGHPSAQHGSGGRGTVETTIATLASQTGFTLTAGSSDDDAYNGWTAVIQDVTTANQTAVGLVSDYVGSTKTITLAADPGIFTMAATDLITLLPPPAALGSPAGASVSADIATVDANVDAILVDTGTTIPATITTAQNDLDIITGASGVVLQDGSITAAKIATDAITADKIAADAIGGSELAADAVTEIQSGLATAAALATVDANVDTILTQRAVPAQNSAFTFHFKMVDATDFATPETSVSVTATRSIDGAAFGAAGGTVTEIANGVYEMAASAADMNGGVITFRFAGSGCADTFVTVVTDGGV